MERFADHVRARIQQAYERGVAQPRVPDSCTTISGGSLISATAADAGRGERDFLRHISGWTRAGDLSWASAPGDACRLHIVASASAQLLHTVKTSEPITAACESTLLGQRCLVVASNNLLEFLALDSFRPLHSHTLSGRGSPSALCAAGSFPVQTGRGAEVDDAQIISDAVVIGFPSGHLELHHPHEPSPSSDRKLLVKNRVGVTALCLVADAARTHTNIGVGFADGNVCLLDLASCHAQPDAKPHLQEFLDLPRAQSKNFSVRELRFEAARFNFTASDRPSLGVLWCAFECSSGRTAAIKVAAAQLEKFKEPATGLKTAASSSLAASSRDGVYRFGLKRLFDGDVVPESAHAGALRLVGFGALRSPTGGLGETERTQCVTDRMAVSASASATSGARGEALALARGWGQGRRFAAWLAFSSNGATHAAVFDVLPENCLDGNAELHRARFSMSMHTLIQSAGDAGALAAGSNTAPDLALAVTLDPESLRDGTLLLSDANPIEHVDAVAASSSAAAATAAAGAAGTDAASLDADGEFSPHELYASDPLVSWSHAALHSIRQHALTFRARVVVCAPSAAAHNPRQPQSLALGVAEIGFVGLQERMLAALTENAAGALAEASAFYRAACDAGLLLPPKSHRAAAAGAALQELPHADYCRGRILSLCVRTGLSCGVGAAWIHARLPDVASWSASASSSATAYVASSSSSSSSSSAAHGGDGSAQASLPACDFLLQDPNWLVRWCGTQFRRMWHGRALADLLTAVDAALSASGASSASGADASTARLQPALALTWAQFARRASAAAAAASSSDGGGVDFVPEHVAEAIARALDGADSVGFASSASAAAAAAAVRSPFELAAALDLFCEYLDGLFLLLTSLRNLRAMRSAVMRACKAHGKHLGRRVHHLRALVFLLRNAAAAEIAAADRAGAAAASRRNVAAAASASSRLIDQARANSVAAVSAQWRADMQVVVPLSPVAHLSSLPPATGVDIVSSSASAAALSAIDAPTSSLRQVLDLCELCRECDEGGASMPLLYLCMQVDEEQQREECEGARRYIQTAHARRSDASSLARRFVDAFRVPAARYHAIAGMFCLDRATEAQTMQGNAAVDDLCNRAIVHFSACPRPSDLSIVHSALTRLLALRRSDLALQLFECWAVGDLLRHSAALANASTAEGSASADLGASAAAWISSLRILLLLDTNQLDAAPAYLRALTAAADDRCGNHRYGHALASAGVGTLLRWLEAKRALKKAVTIAWAPEQLDDVIAFLLTANAASVLSHPSADDATELSLASLAQLVWQRRCALVVLLFSRGRAAEALAVHDWLARELVCCAHRFEDGLEREHDRVQTNGGNSANATVTSMRTQLNSLEAMVVGFRAHTTGIDSASGSGLHLGAARVAASKSTDELESEDGATIQRLLGGDGANDDDAAGVLVALDVHLCSLVHRLASPAQYQRRQQQQHAVDPSQQQQQSEDSSIDHDRQSPSPVRPAVPLKSHKSPALRFSYQSDAMEDVDMDTAPPFSSSSASPFFATSSAQRRKQPKSPYFTSSSSSSAAAEATPTAAAVAFTSTLPSTLASSLLVASAAFDSAAPAGGRSGLAGPVAGASVAVNSGGTPFRSALTPSRSAAAIARALAARRSTPFAAASSLSSSAASATGVGEDDNEEEEEDGAVAGVVYQTQNARSYQHGGGGAMNVDRRVAWQEDVVLDSSGAGYGHTRPSHSQSQRQYRGTPAAANRYASSASSPSVSTSVQRTMQPPRSILKSVQKQQQQYQPQQYSYPNQHDPSQARESHQLPPHSVQRSSKKGVHLNFAVDESPAAKTPRR